MIYMIAGASLSGKTTARKFITSQYGISGIDTDTLRTMTNNLRPDIKVGHNENVLINYENMRETVAAFVYARSFFNEDYVLEGDSLNLEDVATYVTDGTVKAVVVGYPDATVSQRLNIVSSIGSDHWSKTVSETLLLKKIDEFIEYSSFLEREAERLKVPFINISNVNNQDVINKQIITSFSLCLV